MKVVGVRELKNRLSEVLREVKAGEEVLVTERGRVVAELRPPRIRAAEPSENPVLEDMVRKGRLTLGSGAVENAFPDPGPGPGLPAGTALRLLDEERGAR